MTPMPGWVRGWVYFLQDSPGYYRVGVIWEINLQDSQFVTKIHFSPVLTKEIRSKEGIKTFSTIFSQI